MLAHRRKPPQRREHLLTRIEGEIDVKVGDDLDLEMTLFKEGSRVQLPDVLQLYFYGF